MATRLTRSEQVQRNRGLVLAAARRVFLARGYAGATVEAIADEAGFSKGVVYSQFASKGDLFLALLEQRIGERARENESALTAAPADDDDQSFLELMRASGRRSGDDPEWGLLLIEFRLAAARDEDLNARYAQLHARTIDYFAAALEHASTRSGVPLPQPARALAEFILAVDHGTTLERAAEPDALPWPVLEDLFMRILGGRARDVAPTPQGGPR